MDFTLNRYNELLCSLLKQGYMFITYAEYIRQPNRHKFIILRHDVDDRKENALSFARLQHQYEVKGSYYFRTIPQSFDLTITQQIADLGHEIGYHYETMDWAKGNIDLAYELFSADLNELRKHFLIETICMHGSPTSKWDNRAIWQRYNYASLGIIGEPYFDTDFSSVFYMTDTGRKWDGDKVSVRDKVERSDKAFKHLFFRSTNDIIYCARAGELPNKIMMTFHPQRWTNHYVRWVQELVVQSAKNVVKGYIVSRSDKSKADNSIGWPMSGF